MSHAVAEPPPRPAPARGDRVATERPSHAGGLQERAAGWSFVLFALALPVAMAPMNVAGALCAGLTLLAWLTHARGGPMRTPLDGPVLGWLLALGLATLTAEDRAASAASLGKGLIPLLAGVAAWHARHRRRGLAAVIAFLAAGCAASAWGTARFLAAGGHYPTRAIGLTGSWMTFGLQLMLLVSLAAGISIAVRRRGLRLGALASGLVAAVGLATSFTRSAWLGLGASLAVMLGLRRPRVLLVLAAAGGLAWAVLPGDFGDRLRSAFDPGHATNRERTLMWEEARRVFHDHPVTGVGLQNLTPVLERYRSPQAIEHPSHVHNSYLQVAIATGSVGLIAFLALCVGLMRTSASGFLGLRRASGLGAGVRLGVAGGTAGFLVAALFDHAFGDEQLLFLLYTLAGTAWAARGWDAGTEEGARPAPEGGGGARA